jgi:hypothetical protein
MVGPGGCETSERPDCTGRTHDDPSRDVGHRRSPLHPTNRRRRTGQVSRQRLITSVVTSGPTVPPRVYPPIGALSRRPQDLRTSLPLRSADRRQWDHRGSVTVAKGDPSHNRDLATAIGGRSSARPEGPAPITGDMLVSSVSNAQPVLEAKSIRYLAALISLPLSRCAGRGIGLPPIRSGSVSAATSCGLRFGLRCRSMTGPQGSLDGAVRMTAHMTEKPHSHSTEGSRAHAKIKSGRAECPIQCIR